MIIPIIKLQSCDILHLTITIIHWMYNTQSPSQHPFTNSLSYFIISISNIGFIKGKGFKQHKGIDKQDLEIGFICNSLINKLKFVVCKVHMCVQSIREDVALNNIMFIKNQDVHQRTKPPSKDFFWFFFLVIFWSPWYCSWAFFFFW